jgi:hypothetical protein
LALAPPKIPVRGWRGLLHALLQGYPRVGRTLIGVLRKPRKTCCGGRETSSSCPC